MSTPNQTLENVATAIDENMMCPVCKLECGTDARGLSCQHFVCLSCARGLLEFVPDDDDYLYSIEDKGICCPMCRQFTPIQERADASSLPLAYQLQTLRDIKEMLVSHTSHGKPPPKIPFCESCERQLEKEQAKFATVFCKSCDTKFCQECIASHDQHTDFDKHIRTRVDIECEVPCGSHPLTSNSKFSTKFCLTCWCPVCSLCFMSNHQKHETEDISLVVINKLENILDLKAKVSSQLSQEVEMQNKVSRSLEKIQETLDEQYAKVVEVKEEAIAWLENQVTELNNAMLEEFNKKQKDLSETKNYLDDLVSEKKKLAEKLTYLADTAAPVTILKVQQDEFDFKEREYSLILERTMPKFYSTFLASLKELHIGRIAPPIAPKPKISACNMPDTYEDTAAVRSIINSSSMNDNRLVSNLPLGPVDLPPRTRRHLDLRQNIQRSFPPRPPTPPTPPSSDSEEEYFEFPVPEALLPRRLRIIPPSLPYIDSDESGDEEDYDLLPTQSAISVEGIYERIPFLPQNEDSYSEPHGYSIIPTEPPETVYYRSADVSKVYSVYPGQRTEIRDVKFFNSPSCTVMTTNSRERPLIIGLAEDSGSTGESLSARAQVRGIGVGTLTDPWGICVTNDNKIAVVNKQKQIAIMDIEGNCYQTIRGPRFKRLFTIGSCPRTGLLAASDWDDKVVLMIDPRANRVVRSFDDDSNTSGNSGVYGLLPWWPTYISAGSLGGSDIIGVVDEANVSAKVFDIEGNLLNELTYCMTDNMSGRRDRRSWAPNCISVDSVGGVWMMDPQAQAVSRFCGQSFENWREILRIGAMTGKNWNALDFQGGHLAVDTSNRFSANRIDVFRVREGFRSRRCLPPLPTEGLEAPPPRIRTVRRERRHHIPPRQGGGRGRYPPLPPLRNTNE